LAERSGKMRNDNNKLFTVVIGILMVALTGLGALNTLLLQGVERRIEASNRQLEVSTSQLWSKIDRVVNLFEAERNRVLALTDKIVDRLSQQGENISKIETLQEALQEDHLRKEKKK